MFERVGTYYYFFPTYNQGRKIIWEGMDRDGLPFLGHFPKEIIKSKNDTEMRIELINGSAFQVIGTDKIDNIVGTNPVGCIFSEYSLQDPLAWDFIRPILAENGGWAIFVYTPRGINHGFKILQQAKDNNWFWEVLTVEDTKSISGEVLLQEEKEMPDELFQQEYYCKFLDSANSYFKRIDENINKDELSINPNHQFQLGVDLAKYQDWTVITPFNLNTFKVYPQERFNQIDWNLQKAKIEARARQYNNATIRPDSTGVGDPIAEDLERMGLRVEPFKYTEQSKRQLWDNLQIMLSQDKIKIPNDEGLIEELKSASFFLTEGGKIKIGVPDNMTDDRINSLALAVWGASNPINTIQEDFDLYKTEFD